jgi:hypothetical protein
MAEDTQIKPFFKKNITQLSDAIFSECNDFNLNYTIDSDLQKKLDHLYFTKAQNINPISKREIKYDDDAKDYKILCNPTMLQDLEYDYYNVADKNFELETIVTNSDSSSQKTPLTDPYNCAFDLPNNSNILIAINLKNMSTALLDNALITILEDMCKFQKSYNVDILWLENSTYNVYPVLSGPNKLTINCYDSIPSTKNSEFYDCVFMTKIGFRGEYCDDCGKIIDYEMHFTME